MYSRTLAQEQDLIHPKASILRKPSLHVSCLCPVQYAVHSTWTALKPWTMFLTKAVLRSEACLYASECTRRQHELCTVGTYEPPTPYCLHLPSHGRRSRAHCFFLVLSWLCGPSPQIVERVAVPLVAERLSTAYDAMSRRQTACVTAAVSDLLVYDPGAESLKQLLGGALSALQVTLEMD